MIMQTIFAASESPEGIAALGLDPLAFGAQLLTFAVLFFVLKKFALKGIVAKLEERRVTINKGVDLGLEMQASKEKLDTETQAITKKAREQADLIIAEAHEEHGRIVGAAATDAERRAEEIIRTAENRTAEDMANARAQIKAELSDLATAIAAKAVDMKMDSKIDAEYIKKAMI
jgi:F-type H+-transporting ATPase subunit b